MRTCVVLSLLPTISAKMRIHRMRIPGGAWISVRLLVVAALGNLGNRMLQFVAPSQPQVAMADILSPAHVARSPADVPVVLSKLQRGPSLRHAARRFVACARGDDVNLEDFAESTEQMMTIVERFGSFTSRGVADVRQNLRRVREQARKGKNSMRAFLADELTRGGAKPGGGPASRSGAEALLWSRLLLSYWVEIFDEHVRRPHTLADETSRGFKRTLSRYLDNVSRAAFNMAVRQAPDWAEVRQRTSLGCSNVRRTGLEPQPSRQPPPQRLLLTRSCLT